MNELIKINSENQTVSARELHEYLETTERFKPWIERYLDSFTNGEDWTYESSFAYVGNGAERQIDDYRLSIDMAKHICLMSRTEKGKQCRQYLIEIEKAWNTPEQIFARALKLADETIKNLSLDVERMKPKEEFFDAVTDSKDAIPMADVAKVLDLGIGRNKLFTFLRNNNILQSDNRPYQKYIDNGWFRTIEQKYDKGYGETGINIKTLVFQKGVDGIRRLLIKEQ